MRLAAVLLLAACQTSTPEAPEGQADRDAAGDPAIERPRGHIGDHHKHKEAHGAQEGPHADKHACGHGDHRFADAERWAKVFDDPDRDAWQKPAALVEALEIAPGSTVADAGAGTGYLAPHLSRAVGPEGRVVLLDIEETLVAHMTERIGAEGLSNAEARVTPPDDPGVKPGEADLVVLLDVAHHIADRPAWFRTLRERIQPGGRVAIVDFREGELPVGPPPDHRLPPTQLEGELTAAGWTLVASPEVLPHQYVRVFQATEMASP